MQIREGRDLKCSDITPKHLYFGRRDFLLGLLGTTAAVAGCEKTEQPTLEGDAGPVPAKLKGLIKGPYSTDEAQTPYSNVTHYNNFYEFCTDKGDPANNAKNLITSPWTVSVEGEVKEPRKFTMDEILKLAPLEERIYRHRCVEAWSIVVPWIGYSFNVLAKLVEPTSGARYVAFESYYDVKQMSQGGWAGISFPYVEGSVSTKPCTRLRFSASGCTATHCRTRTARRCV
jgi:methionine sulfoxide reductase catalytic subunit